MLLVHQSECRSLNWCKYESVSVSNSSHVFIDPTQAVLSLQFPDFSLVSTHFVSTLIAVITVDLTPLPSFGIK